MAEVRWETKHRYYAVRVYQDLLGDWVIHSVWDGLQNNLGNGHRQVVSSHEDAAMVLERIHKERRAKARDSQNVGSCSPSKLTSSISGSWSIVKMVSFSESPSCPLLPRLRLSVEMTGAYADRIVRHLLGRVNGFSC